MTDERRMTRLPLVYDDVSITKAEQRMLRRMMKLVEKNLLSVVSQVPPSMRVSVAKYLATLRRLAAK